MQHFVEYDEVHDVVSRGSTRSTVYLRNGMQVDLRVVEQKSFGAALQYFTGSKAHNIQLRRLGQQRGLKNGVSLATPRSRYTKRWACR